MPLCNWGDRFGSDAAGLAIPGTSQSVNDLVPFDALHPMQHNAMLAGVMIV